MKTELYTFYDKIAMQCGPVNHARNEADMMRAFSKAFKERDDSDDFELLHLGSYDHDKGVIEAFDLPRKIPISISHTGGNDDGKAVSERRS